MKKKLVKNFVLKSGCEGKLIKVKEMKKTNFLVCVHLTLEFYKKTKA